MDIVLFLRRPNRFGGQRVLKVWHVASSNMQIRSDVALVLVPFSGRSPVAFLSALGSRREEAPEYWIRRICVNFVLTCAARSEQSAKKNHRRRRRDIA